MFIYFIIFISYNFPNLCSISQDHKWYVYFKQILCFDPLLRSRVSKFIDIIQFSFLFKADSSLIVLSFLLLNYLQILKIISRSNIKINRSTSLWQFLLCFYVNINSKEWVYLWRLFYCLKYISSFYNSRAFRLMVLSLKWGPQNWLIKLIW